LGWPDGQEKMVFKGRWSSRRVASSGQRDHLILFAELAQANRATPNPGGEMPTARRTPCPPSCRSRPGNQLLPAHRCRPHSIPSRFFFSSHVAISRLFSDASSCPIRRASASIRERWTELSFYLDLRKVAHPNRPTAQEKPKGAPCKTRAGAASKSPVGLSRAVGYFGRCARGTLRFNTNLGVSRHGGI
jgi:hypothetical protein